MNLWVGTETLKVNRGDVIVSSLSGVKQGTREAKAMIVTLCLCCIKTNSFLASNHTPKPSQLDLKLCNWSQTKEYGWLGENLLLGLKLHFRAHGLLKGGWENISVHE